MDKDYSILIQSTDSYSDTWVPFFTLFNFYWPNYKGKIYLSTEYLDFSFKGLNIISTKIGCKKNGKSFTWSESVLKSVENIETDYILFILDDLFLNKTVNDNAIENMVEEMKKKDISILYLTNQSSLGPFIETENELLYEIDQKANYRISALIALWRKETFLKYIQKEENPWEFEIFGTKRAHYIKDKIYTVNPEIYNGKNNYLISHIDPTGITRGKWQKNVVSLFMKHNIFLDYDKRGFYDENLKKGLLLRIKRKISLNRNIKLLRSKILISKLKKCF